MALYIDIFGNNIFLKGSEGTSPFGTWGLPFPVGGPSTTHLKRNTPISPSFLRPSICNKNKIYHSTEEDIYKNLFKKRVKIKYNKDFIKLFK